MLMKNKLMVVAAGAALMFAAAVPVVAHHAFGAEFDANRPVLLKGKIVKVELVNPHAWIHIDVKKVGRIPDGGGWRIHGINSDQARAAARATAKAKASGTRPGYVYLHSAVDGFSRLAYTEALEDETAKTAIETT